MPESFFVRVLLRVRSVERFRFDFTIFELSFYEVEFDLEIDLWVEEGHEKLYLRKSCSFSRV